MTGHPAVEKVRAQLTQWADVAIAAAKAKGHDLGPFQEADAWGAAVRAECLDCRRNVFVGYSGAVSGYATTQRCEWVAADAAIKVGGTD